MTVVKDKINLIMADKCTICQMEENGERLLTETVNTFVSTDSPYYNMTYNLCECCMEIFNDVKKKFE